MDIQTINDLEKKIVLMMNAIQDWDLKWAGGGYEHFDAWGYTPNGNKCLVEMKFRNKYYSDKLLEKYKYDKLMSMDEDFVKIYFVSDPRGTYYFWLNDLQEKNKMPQVKELYCPDTTLWTKKKVLKKVYLLTEDLAVRIDK